MTTETPTPEATTTPSPTPTNDAPAPETKPEEPAKVEAPTQLLGEDEAESETKPEEAKEGEADKKDGDGDYVPLTREDFVIADEFELPEKISKEFTDYINEKKIPKAEAQRLLDLHIEAQHAGVEAWHKQVKAWGDELKADPELGGANLAKNTKLGNDLIRTFGDDEFKQDIKQLGFGNKKSFMRFLTKIAPHLKEDDMPSGNKTPGKKSAAEVFYPGMKKA